MNNPYYSQPPPTRKKSPVVPLLLGVGVLAVVGVVIYIILKKKAAASSSSSSSTSSSQGGGGSSSTSTSSSQAASSGPVPITCSAHDLIDGNKYTLSQGGVLYQYVNGGSAYPCPNSLIPTTGTTCTVRECIVFPQITSSGLTFTPFTTGTTPGILSNYGTTSTCSTCACFYNSYDLPTPSNQYLTVKKCSNGLYTIQSAEGTYLNASPNNLKQGACFTGTVPTTTSYWAIAGFNGTFPST